MNPGGRAGAKGGEGGGDEGGKKSVTPRDLISTPSCKNIRPSSDLRKKSSQERYSALLISCFASLRALVLLECLSER